VWRFWLSIELSELTFALATLTLTFAIAKWTLTLTLTFALSEMDFDFKLLTFVIASKEYVSQWRSLALSEWGISFALSESL
jgi:hypothetical protein